MITNQYLKDTIADARSKNGIQHAMDKESLIDILEELLECRLYLEALTPDYIRNHRLP